MDRVDANKTPMQTVNAFLVLSLGVWVFSGCSPRESSSETRSSLQQVKPYPLDRCLVSDEPFDHGRPIVITYQGRQIHLCCGDCQRDFEMDPARYLAKLDSQLKGRGLKGPIR